MDCDNNILEILELKKYYIEFYRGLKEVIMNDHTFAICAYKESEYLEECIKSLKNQTVSTNIILATSTPNDYISGLCSKYNIEMFVNNGEHGITQDWNFAYAKADSKYVTIAHQDDVYELSLIHISEPTRPY